MVLANQASSTSCYSDSDTTLRSWNAALLDCTMTPGAYLWRPNTEAEADAVRNKYSIPNNVPVWTGANDLAVADTFTFAIENSPLNVATPPFGTGALAPGPNTDCVQILFNDPNFEWSNVACATDLRYICELPRRVCP
ncbi:tetranectin-like isoform X2 [Mytilus edulis]|uniref:tetranectin-like isoform X2 n=1 Tax=Mytilus edulis TaxID=6550 RepID=UPI0039EE38FB